MDEDKSAVQIRTEIARCVVLALSERGHFFYHAELRDFDSAMFFDRQRRRLERMRSDALLSWLSDWLAVNRADAVFKYVSAEVETAALAGAISKPILPEAFWASRPGAVYLSNGDGRAVRVTKAGPELVDNGADEVLFAAGRTCSPWTFAAPMDPFEACALFRGLQAAAPHGRDLFKLWALSLPTNPRSKPPICFAGEIGSGKTRTAKGLAELYGIPFVAAKVEKEKESEFWPAIDQGGLVTFDNADTKVPWLADALASAATDGCSSRRRLYTNSEQVVLRPRAWIGITPANPTFANDPGLADRILVVRMNRRDGETGDAELSDEIAQARDAGLSYIVQTIGRGLADDSPAPPGLNTRHPDFAAFAVRLGRSIGRGSQAIEAIHAAEDDKSRFCLENDIVGSALLAFIGEALTWTGTAAELKAKLTEIDGDLADWSPKRIGKRLSALWPHIASILNAQKELGGHSKVTVFRFSNAGFAGFQTAFP